MSKIRKIEDLSKKELLSLIYNNFGGNTRIWDHECQCASCGEEVQYPDDCYFFICDKCEEAESTECEQCGRDDHKTEDCTYEWEPEDETK